MTTPVRLYWNKICPFVQRAWIAALEKRVPLELVHVPLGDDMPEWYAKINPRQTVPTLQVGDQVVFESNLIAQFLDDNFEPKRSLFPGSAYDRHRIKFFMEQVGEYVGYAYEFLGNGESEEAQKDFRWNMNNIEKLLVEQSSTGPFFLGETFSLADIALVPFLDRFRHTLSAYANGFNIFEGVPRTKALFEAALRRPSVFQTSQSGEFYIDAYKSYSKVPRTQLPLKLYTSLYCPFAERSRIAAALKQVPVEEAVLDLDNVPEYYTRDVNPRGTVPSLVLANGNVVHESNLVVEYFDEEYPTLGAALLPRDDALKRYQVSLFLEVSGSLVGAIWGFLYGKGTEEKRKNLQEAAKAVEELLEAQSAGPFFLGSAPSAADVSIIPHLVRLGVALPEFGNGYTTFFAEFPRIAALDNAAREHEVIGKVLKEPDFYLPHLRRRIASH